VLRGNALEIIGAIGICCAIDSGTHRLEFFKILTRIVLGALKHQMLKQMGKTGATCRLVLGADVVPNIDLHNRQIVVLGQNNRQAIFKGVHLVGHTQLRGECARKGGDKGEKGR
jgi:hypothetical protein